MDETASNPGPVSNEPAPSSTSASKDEAVARAIAHDAGSIPALTVRSIVGGVLMGLANLVPGISGGTMLVAAGIYTRFINAIAEVTTFRFRLRSLLVLGVVIVAAVVAIATLAGPVKDLVVHHRWIMYSLFIGLTLGGVPLVWRMARPASPGVWVGMAVGFAGMALLAIAQQTAAGGGGPDRTGLVMMFIAGVAGASAMILPGVSGGYLLLVLGVYVPILAAIDQCKVAVGTQQFDALTGPGFSVVLPVGVGVVVGVVVVSNLLRWLLQRYEKPTLGVLLGLLLGAVVGLYPFQEIQDAELIELVKGREVTIENSELVYADNFEVVDISDYPTIVVWPHLKQFGQSAGLVLAGFAFTAFVAWMGREKETA